MSLLEVLFELKMRSFGSSVQVEIGNRHVTLRKRDNQSLEEVPDNEGVESVTVAAVAETPLEKEKKWFAAQLRKRLLMTRAALKVTGNTILDDDNVVEEISWLASLEEVLDALGEAQEMFMAMFNEEKWAKLKASQESIAQGKVRALRMKRHVSRMSETRQDAVVDLTAATEQSDDGIAEFVETSRSLAELAWQKKKDEKGVEQKRARKSSKKIEKEQEEGGNEQEEEEVAVEKTRDQPARKKREKEENEDDEDDGFVEKRQLRKKVDVAKEKGENAMVEENTDTTCDDFLAALEQAAEDRKTVAAMLKEVAAAEKVVLKLENMAVPDPTAATPARGAVLVTKKEDLVRCLRETEPVDQIEQWGDFLKWRRIAKRAFEIAGLFAFLRSRDSEGGSTIAARYKYATKDVGKVLSHPHAARYDRLGRFLLEFPQFVNQLQFVKLNDWFQKVTVTKGRSVVVMDAVKKLLSDEQLEFWKKQPEEVCVVCSQTQTRARLWTCPDCGGLFHEMCAGYDGSTVCDDVQVHIFCHQCLPKHAMTPDDVAAQVVEIKAVAGYLMAAGCPFVLERLADNGAALFQILEKCARTHFGFKGTTAEFCRRVAQAAESDSGILKRMAADRSKPAKLLAEKDVAWEVERVLAGFCKLFNDCVEVNIFVVRGHALEKVCMFGAQGSAVEVNMLLWGTTKHYDCLEKRD